MTFIPTTARKLEVAKESLLSIFSRLSDKSLIEIYGNAAKLLEIQDKSKRELSKEKCVIIQELICYVLENRGVLAPDGTLTITET